MTWLLSGGCRLFGQENPRSCNLVLSGEGRLQDGQCLENAGSSLVPVWSIQ